MFIELTSPRGKKIIVNVLYIKSIKEKKNGTSQVTGSFGMTSMFIADEPPDELMRRVNDVVAGSGLRAVAAETVINDEEDLSGFAGGGLMA